MHVEPQDGWTSDPETAWTLADTNNGPVLIDSMSNSSIHLTRKWKAQTQLWLNPRSGEERTAEASELAHETLYIKPDSGEWLLLLK